MSEGKMPGLTRDENPVDVIKRTVGDRIVIIHSYLEGGAVKFRAQLLGGPTVLMEHYDGSWAGNHPDAALVAQLGEIIESASD